MQLTESIRVLDSRLRQSLGDRIPDVKVTSIDDQLVVCGRVRSFYMLQLTLVAINRTLCERDGEVPFDVEVAIQVGDAASDFHCVCQKRTNGDQPAADPVPGKSNGSEHRGVLARPPGKQPPRAYVDNRNTVEP